MIAIVKYNAGNIMSVKNALQRLSCDSVITDNPEEIKKAEKVIFPGVGEASSAMRFLKERGLDTVLKNLEQPVLGICLGMQLMCKHSEEGDTECIGIFENIVKKFPATDIIPHMGWNNFAHIKGSIFEGIKKDENVYYVHSYYAGITHQTSAVCEYILPFSAALQKANFYGTQFHPEKSAAKGEQILKNFLLL